MLKLKKLLILLLIAALFIGCSSNSSPENSVTQDPISKTEFFMGTVVTITLYDSDDTSILDKAFKTIKEIEELVSINTSNTELDSVNNAAGKNPIQVSNTTFNIIEKGLEYSKLSNGAFDITVGPLVKLWSIGLPEAKLPTQEEIDNTIPLVDYTKLELDSSNRTVFLKESNMVIDLGSIAKGYAADEVVNILKENGVKSAIIDLGGNIYAYGLKPLGSDWKIGIQDPFSTRGDIIGILPVNNKTIVTSGIYERVYEENGVKYHHLLNPDTGYPFDNDIAGVSIITESSIDADALSTTVFSKGLFTGLDFVESLDSVDAIFISKDKKVYVSSGLKDTFILNNPDFTLVN